MKKAACRAPFAAPAGWKWIFPRTFRHARSGKVLDARDYGYESWRFLVRA